MTRAGERHCFDLEKVAAKLCPSHAVDDTDLIFRRDALTNKLLLAHEGAEIFQCDAHALLLLAGDDLCSLAAAFFNGAFQVSHTCLACVAIDEFKDRFIVHIKRFRAQTVLFHLLRNEMILSDSKFFGSRVGVQIDDLHTVEKGTRNRIEAIRRGDKHTVRKIDRELHKMIAEGLILLAVKYFQHRGGRVAAHIACHFIDLIKEDEGVIGLRFDERVDDSTGHGADVSLSVTADLRLIMHTAEGYAHEFTVNSACDGGGDGGLTRAGRADKANDLTAKLGIELQRREIFDDAFLHLFKTIVIFLKNTLHFGDVDAFLCGNKERNLKANLNIIAKHGVFCRTEGDAGKTLDLLGERFLHLFGVIALFQTLCIAAKIVIVVFVVFAKLLVNNAKLLAQVEIALIFLHALVHFFFDISAFFKDALLRFEHIDELCSSCRGRKFFEKLLLLLMVRKQIFCREVAGLAEIANRRKEEPKFLREFGCKFSKFFDQSLKLTKERRHAELAFFLHKLFFVNVCIGDLFIEIFRKHCSCQRLDDNAENTALCFDDLLNSGDNADGEDFTRLRDLRQRILLADHEDLSAVTHSVFKDFFRRTFIHIHGHGDAGKSHDAVEHRTGQMMLFNCFCGNHISPYYLSEKRFLFAFHDEILI